MTQIRSLKEVFTSLADALTADSDIAAFMAENYGTGATVSVLIGVDPEDLPEIPDTALIALTPGYRSRSRGDAYSQHQISVACFVFDKSESTDGNIKSLNALGLVDAFANLVEKCAFNALQAMNVAVTPTAGDGDLIAYPVARAELAYIIEIPRLI